MSMSKGVDLLIDALALLRDVPVSLCLIGGPESMTHALRDRWSALGLPIERFLYVGRLAPADVPVGIAAFDVCTMPFPWTEHFAYHASPLKLFEYMACGGTILSSDLPATAEVVRDGETALLVPPGDVAALAHAMRRLYDDPALRQRLGQAAQHKSARYTWQARAESILATMKG
jgi:glycogen(starch) synthase